MSKHKCLFLKLQAFLIEKKEPFKVDKQICCFGIVYEREKERKSERKKSETREREKEKERKGEKVRKNEEREKERERKSKRKRRTKKKVPIYISKIIH